jgi:hypothetical protein
MFGTARRRLAGVLIAAIAGLLHSTNIRGQESPALNPFGTDAERQQRREDAVPGYLELSDGTIHPGLLSLTRDARLKIFEEERKQFREIPWSSIKRIDCTVSKEWVEEEWRFKENASDEKYFTGRTYPAREYAHTVTLQNDRTIRGPLAGIVYVQADPAGESVRYLLHKRDKGEPGTALRSLVYVRSIRLGEKALEEGKRRAARGRAVPRRENGPASSKGRRN